MCVCDRVQLYVFPVVSHLDVFPRIRSGDRRTCRRSVYLSVNVSCPLLSPLLLSSHILLFSFLSILSSLSAFLHFSFLYFSFPSTRERTRAIRRKNGEMNLGEGRKRERERACVGAREQGREPAVGELVGWISADPSL